MKPVRSRRSWPRVSRASARERVARESNLAGGHQVGHCLPLELGAGWHGHAQRRARAHRPSTLDNETSREGGSIWLISVLRRRSESAQLMTLWHFPDTVSCVDDVVGVLAQAREVAGRSVNAIMMATYWSIGRRIVVGEQASAERAEYGQALIAQLAEDLTGRFGRGFSARNPAPVPAVLPGFVFDPWSQAVLLVAGNKAGNWTHWYDENIPVAEGLYEQWLVVETKRREEQQ